MSKDYDVLIRNALIVDGTGRPAFEGSICIEDERVAAIVSRNSEASAQRDLNAEGLVASPGFINMHSHADLDMLRFPLAQSCILQGVTTIVGGNCGLTAAPIKNVCQGTSAVCILEWLHEVEPLWGISAVSASNLTLPFPLDKVNEKFKEKLGWIIDWRKFNEFLGKVERTGTSVNYVPLVGHNAIRTAVMENDYKRKARQDETEEMREYVNEAMEAGAFGLSTGLSYSPGKWSDTSEVVELVKVVKDYKGLYFTHFRGFGDVMLSGSEGRLVSSAVEGLNEAMEVCETCKVPLHISHLLSLYRIFPSPPPTLRKAAVASTLSMIDKASQRKLDVSFDLIPNTSGGGLLSTKLVVFLRPWLIETGSIEKLVENLKKEEFRQKIREAGPRTELGALILVSENLTIIRCTRKAYENKTLAEIACLKGKALFDTLFDLLIEDSDTRYKMDLATEEEVSLLIRHSLSMIGTDTGSFESPRAKWSMDYPIKEFTLPDQNSFGAYPRYIRKYVRESNIVSLEEAIRKATFMPAKRLGLKDRGAIGPGMYADIVIFDFRKITDRGDWFEPCQEPEGISVVMVNGKIAYENGQHTGLKTGKVLKHNT